MQILEDNIEDYGDLAKRIAALREQVAVLMEQKQKAAVQEPTLATKEVIVEAPINETLVQENKLLKKQLEDLTKNDGVIDSSVNNDLVNEIVALKKQLEEKESTINDLPGKTLANDDVVQENSFLKKQLEDKEKTIKELGFKLEMLKMAKNLRSGALVNEKSEELKKIINEYIKELDKNIASLNIK